MSGDNCVMTCLECGKRRLYEGYYGLHRAKKNLTHGCAQCGSNELVTSILESFASAKKLSETPIRPEFVAMHKVMRNKLKVLSLLTEMLECCDKELLKAELADEPQRLKAIIKWLGAVAIQGTEVGPWDSGDTENEQSPLPRT